ncbi:MAG: hypothetical protein KGD73_08810, partial [Candidatus Lokiarchaeota archaeon]|nr:hypothetical protein [Candidatus Lokiarchaeota archaeon]
MGVFENFDGWLLDVSTNATGVIFWVKTITEEKIVKIYAEFCPEFFAVPKESVGYDLDQLTSILMQNPNIKNVRTCEKYVKLEDHEKTKLLGVSVEKPSVFKATIKEIDKLDIFTLYNTDLPISQMYYYVNDLFPMSRCQFKVKIKMEKEKQKMHLVSFILDDDNEKLFYELPPLKAIWLEVKVQQRGMRSYYNDPLAYAEI